MASDRLQRQLNRLLDEAAEAVAQGDWALVRDCAQKALVAEPGTQEALSFLAVAERGLESPRSRRRSHRSSRLMDRTSPTRNPAKPAVGRSAGSTGGFSFWLIFGLMYIFTSDTVEPFGKLEFFWRMLAGTSNFLPWL